MAQLVGAQGRPKVARKQKHPHLWRSPQRNPKPKTKIFFSILTRRLAESVEGLNSFLALANLLARAVVKGSYNSNGYQNIFSSKHSNTLRLMIYFSLFTAIHYLK